MAAVHGKTAAFFVANNIVDAEKKRAVFLSVVGPAMYKLLGELLAPVKPGDKSYDELVEVVMNHCNPTPSKIVKRFKFHTRFRRPGKLVATYVSKLRSLARPCKFGSSLEDMLRDRIVCVA